MVANCPGICQPTSTISRRPQPAAATATEVAAKATFFTKVKAGSATLLSVVNKARTVEAIAKGELPPPPISIKGESFRDWMFITAKEKMQEEAMEAGQEYIARKMTAKEEAALKAEIAQMQRELIRLMPPEIHNIRMSTRGDGRESGVGCFRQRGRRFSER